MLGIKALTLKKIMYCIYLVLNLSQIYNALPDIIWLLGKHNYGKMFLQKKLRMRKIQQKNGAL